MSLTIDQQRQRVEQEMTRMVDDLDRTVLRKMQVITKMCWKQHYEIAIHHHHHIGIWNMEWMEFDVSNFLMGLFCLFQGEMHLCASKCCDDKSGSIDFVQNCIERCSAPVNRAQQYVQKELGEYQGRLQRCVMVKHTKHYHFRILIGIYLFIDKLIVIFVAMQR